MGGGASRAGRNGPTQDIELKGGRVESGRVGAVQARQVGIPGAVDQAALRYYHVCGDAGFHIHGLDSLLSSLMVPWLHLLAEAFMYQTPKCDTSCTFGTEWWVQNETWKAGRHFSYELPFLQAGMKA